MHSIYSTAIKNYDGTYDIIISLYPDCQEEFSKELSDTGTFLPRRKIRSVKIIMAGLLAISVPLYCFSSKNSRYAMSYVYFGTQTSQMEYIALAKDTLSVISPSYFDIEDDGSIKINHISESYVTSMHNMGIKVVPFLSNHWNRNAGKAALENIDSVVATLVSAIKKHNLDGINIDIENVTHSEKDKYTELVRRLRNALPRDKEVSVAVAANPYGWSEGWHGSYDYAALSDYADHLFIMAYDEHYQGGAPGPVAGVDFVEESIQYALEFCPGEKIVLGIPFFGRIWSDTDSSVNGIGVSVNRAEKIIADTKAVVSFDYERMSPKAEFTIKEGQTISLSGKTLKPGRYTMWYENGDSIKTKLSLVDKYSLKGAGNWSLGQETKNVWDYYHLWLNGKYFSDIMTHFAKDDIQSISSLGLMARTGEHTFSPYEEITRAEMAAAGAGLLGLSPKSGMSFKDIKGHSAEKEIIAVSEAGLMIGYPDGTFKPDKKVSREEAAAFISRAISIDVSKSVAHFSDIDAERWSFDEISALADSGIITGYPDGTFRPEKVIDRGEMAALLNRITSQ